MEASAQVTAPGVSLRPTGPDDTERVHALYLSVPGYFDVLNAPVPSAEEVRTELEAAAGDPRRRTELILLHDDPSPATPDPDPHTGAWVAGYLDVTLDYIEKGDATVNLLLVRTDLQRRGIGAACMRALEERLQGRATRVLASVYGSNPAARRFWHQLGYRFAIDAAPVLAWYAKRIVPSATPG